MAKITGRDKRVAEWLEKIGIDPKNTRRVVIDIPCDGPIWIYIEQFGDSAMFEVEPPPELTTAIKVVPSQTNFEEAIKIIKGLKSSEQQIIPSDWEAIRNYSGQNLKISDESIKNLTSEQEPTPEWLAEFEAKQQAAISKWEHPDD